MVLGIVVMSFVLTGLVPDIVSIGIFGWRDAGHGAIVFSAVVSTFTAPYAAHVLSVLYYRLTDPELPTIDPSVRRWPSVWKGPA